MSTQKINQDDFIIGDRLRRARKLRGMSQEDVAEVLGITKSYVSNIELGKRIPGRHVKVVLENWLQPEQSDRNGEGPNPECKSAKNSAEVAASITTHNPDARDRIIKQRAAALLGKQPPDQAATGKDHEAGRPPFSPQDGAQIAYRVLSSNTRYAGALWENLLSFQKAVEREEEMESMREMMVKMMEKIDRLESRLIDETPTEKRDPAANA
jgi:transcriptional regulator with XRE-family HTH domain